MDTTRPLDQSLRNPDLQAGAIRRVAVAKDAVAARGQTAPPPVAVAESVEDTRRLLDAANEEVDRLDEETIAALKAQIDSGTFETDLDALTDRLLSDAFDAPPRGGEFTDTAAVG